MSTEQRTPTAEGIEEAHRGFPHDLIIETPLKLHARLSEQYGASVHIKDESAQPVRSYKNRGAFTAMRRRICDTHASEFVAASAGNHAQGVAASCNYHGVHGTIFMPTNTTDQKIRAAERFGNGHVSIELVGDDFDEAEAAALELAEINGRAFIHPFNDPNVIEGQGTVGLEILDQMRRLRKKADIILVPIGGGGLASGVGTYVKEQGNHVRIIGVEPEETAAMYKSRKKGAPVTLGKMSSFVAGAAVKRPGDLTYRITEKVVDDLMMVPENRVCSTLLELHDIDGIQAELAGVLSIDALKDLGEEIRGKTVVCVLSGSNVDVRNYPEVIERSQRYEQRKKYLTIELPNRPQALRELLEIFPIGVNITHMKYEASSSAALLIGVESRDPRAISELMRRLKAGAYVHEEVTNDPNLAEMLS